MLNDHGAPIRFLHYQQAVWIRRRSIWMNCFTWNNRASDVRGERKGLKDVPTSAVTVPVLDQSVCLSVCLSHDGGWYSEWRIDQSVTERL
jgi:hypothetical protein